MSSNWKNLLFPGPKSREENETLALYLAVKEALPRTPFPNMDAVQDFIADVTLDVFEKLEMPAAMPMVNAMYDAIRGLMEADGFLLSEMLPEEKFRNLSLAEGIEMRRWLRRTERFLSGHERILPLWREKVAGLFSGILGYYADSAFLDPKKEEHSQSVVFPSARAIGLIDDLPEVLERVIVTYFDKDVVEAEIFELIRETLEHNVLKASGVPKDRPGKAPPKLVLPTQHSKISPEALVDIYFQGTPFPEFLNAELPFAIPFGARFEHTHIVGGTGHGKTQLLQYLIHHDLTQALHDGRGLVVIDSQGDLLRNISRLSLFDPDDPDSLSDRLVIIDPTDVEHPVALNMFDFDRGALETATPLEREMTLNATVETYEYFFGALLGAELTARQGVIFRYIARLLLEIPDATIHTLRELMESGERFHPYIEKLTGSARHFFETQFFERQFNETKKQILARLWGVLSNATVERMFSHTENRVNLFRLLNEGKIVLINTAKDFLGHDGASILGRFFISLTAQAALQRAGIPAEDRTPAFVYIDEAQDYFDANISRLLNQARKYKIGLVFAHQNLDQLDAGLRATVLASTSVKFAGGVSSKDAHTLDSEFRADADFLLSQKKHAEYTEFACYVKNYTGRAVSLQIPLGYLEKESTISEDDYEFLLDENREQYSAPPIEVKFEYPKRRETPPKEPARRPPAESIVDAEPAPAHVEAVPEPAASRPAAERASPPPKEATAPGRGGQEHKYLQQLVKKFAEQRGFGAEIEATVAGGRVDVALRRKDITIAVEISVTGTPDYELGNVEKCVTAGYGEIWLVVSDRRKRERLAKETSKTAGITRVQVLAPEDLLSAFEALPPLVETSEEVVGGRTVRVRRKAASPEESAKRQATIAEVIAKSMLRRQKDDRG